MGVKTDASDAWHEAVADIQDVALLRMDRALRRKTGCHLTYEMIEALQVSLEERIAVAVGHKAEMEKMEACCVCGAKGDEIHAAYCMSERAARKRQRSA